MAVMYPAGIYSGTRSPGERDLFERLRDDHLISDWVVLHSLDIAEHRSQIQGEADFVIVAPNKGVLCLEVKAVTKVRCDHGVWYLGSSSVPDYRGPFKQAAEAMHSIRTYVAREAPELSRVPFFSAVVFPYVDLDAESTEWHRWQLIDRSMYEGRPIGEIITQVLDQARDWLSASSSAKWFHKESGHPTIEEVRKLASILRPSFECFESPASRTGRRVEELKRYTEEQFEALDAMSANARTIFSGPAGTGKTLLAMEAARRAQIGGQRVLFLCFNSFLGQWLSERMQSLWPQVRTSTLHSYMMSVSGVDVPVGANHRFWELTLPAAATDALLGSSDKSNFYDVLVIDEAQDVIREPYLDLLDLSISGGLGSGEWRMFGDFRRQAIYGEGAEQVNALMSGRFLAIPRYSLTVNCRNPFRIAEYVHLLGNLDPPYTRIRRPDNGLRPRIKVYSSEELQSALLTEELELLSEDGIRPEDIVILSFRAGENSIAARVAAQDCESMIPFKVGQVDSKIGYTTVHAFKGLEAPVVIVTDVDSVATERAQSLFYIAISRAIERLCILVHEDAREDLLTVLLSNNKGVVS